MNSTTKRGIDYDQLTGLYSRWYCRMELQKILDAGENRVFGVLDVDGFSQINDQYGMITGDQLLMAIAKALTETYQYATLGRIASDEFAFILAPTSYNRHQMSLMTRNLFEHLHSIRVEGLEGYKLSFSIGTVFIDPNHHLSPDDIYREGTESRLMAKKHEGTFLCSRYGVIPDVEGAFMNLLDDRTLYDSINNRLFCIHNEQDWMAYMREGAKLKGDMFKRNQIHLDDIKTYYSTGDLPDYDYEMLFQLVVNYVKTLDAFMFEMLVNQILLPYYEQCDRNDNKVRSRLGHLYLLMADSLISVYRMGDHSQHKRILDFLHKSKEVTCSLPHDSIQFEPYFYALCEQLGHYESFELMAGNIEMQDLYYEDLRDLLIGPNPFVIPDYEVYKHFKYLVTNARFFPLLRACYLKLKGDQLTPQEQQELELRLDYIRRHVVDGLYDMAGDDQECISMSKMLQKLLLETPDNEALLAFLMSTLHNVKKLEFGTRSHSNLTLVTYLYVGLSQVIEGSPSDTLHRRQLGIEMYEIMAEILRKRESIAADSQILFLVKMLIGNMTASKVLTAADKYHYLQLTMASINLETYSHSRAVAAYAKVILSNMIDNYPHLLAGQGRPYATVDDVKSNRENLLEFMDHACMLHDVGKMYLTPISSNAFRRLTEQEFDLIRRHPMAGEAILRNEPAFEPFIPFVYTHHRWWNNEYGYPKVSQDEKRSPLQDLVYIMSFCDSLEAATSRIGRNYRTAKSFLQIMDEFYAEEGTRYSSDVLHSIISSPETYYKLKQMVDHKWQNIYQSIFQEMVSSQAQRQLPRSDAKLPDPYEHAASKSTNALELHSTFHHLPVPKWLLNLKHEDLLLYTFSLMEHNYMTVRNTGNIFFRYHVPTDTIALLCPDEDQQVHHIMGKHFSERRLDLIISEDAYHSVVKHLKQVISSPSTPKQGWMKLETNDKSKKLRASYSCVQDNHQNVLSIVGYLEDSNTQRDRLLRTIKTQNKYMEVLDCLSESFLVSVYTSINCQEFEILNCLPELQEVANQTTDIEAFVKYACLATVDKEYREGFMQFFNKETVIERLKGHLKIAYEYHSEQSGWLKAIILPAGFDQKSNITHLLVLVESVDEEHLQKDVLTQAASFDALTGLYNRQKGEELIRKQIAEGGSQIFAILDCDNFKRINDQLSHLVGDKVLREQSRVLSECFANYKVMRLGGDEFVVHIGGEEAIRLINAFNGVKDLFQLVSDRLSTIRLPELENIAPTMSCGVVFSGGSVTNLTFEHLYRAADDALKQSKIFRNGTVTINELRYREFYG